MNPFKFFFVFQNFKEAPRGLSNYSFFIGIRVGSCAYVISYLIGDLYDCIIVIDICCI